MARRKESKRVLGSVERSRQFRFLVGYDHLRVIPKRVAGVPQVVHNISLDAPALLLGYGTTVTPNVSNDMSELLVVNNVKQRVIFPAEMCH